MSNYYDDIFLSKMKYIPSVIFEIGARYGDESIKLSKIFKKSKIFSFECNPNTINICRENLINYENITFIEHGLGEKNTTLPFYSFTDNNDGASSFYKRIDSNKTQKNTGTVEIKKLSEIMEKYKINKIDLLCMDVQGFELNVLKGAEENIKKIKYVIMEEPKSIINTRYLPINMHSKYIGSPSSDDIKKFMEKNNFIEIMRVQENAIEDNVMYENIIYNNLQG